MRVPKYEGSTVGLVRAALMMLFVCLYMAGYTDAADGKHATTPRKQLGATPNQPVFVKEIASEGETPESKALTQAAVALSATASALSAGERDKKASNEIRVGRRGSR